MTKRKDDGPKDEPRKKIKPIILDIQFFEPRPIVPNYPSEEEYVSDYDDIDKEVEIFLKRKLNCISDLIKLGKDYLVNENDSFDKDKKYNLNLEKLVRLIEPMEKLQNLIGMESVKKNIFDLLIYQLQEFDKNYDMLHTVIYGEPGVGKTELSKILAEIYLNMKNKKKFNPNIIKFVKRSDLVGGYLGQTAIKTQKVLDSCKGGVIVIDEAYSLGNEEGRDSYSKECIDTINAFLSESPDTIMIIIGYKEHLEKCFFAHNKGLERRFTYKFSIEPYSCLELKLILQKIINNNDWTINLDTIPTDFFIKNKDSFKYNGGDILNLFSRAKFQHSLRYLSEGDSMVKKEISYDDLVKAHEVLNQQKTTKNDEYFPTHFYT